MILRTSEPGVGFFLPEIRRLRAECLLRHGPSHFDEAIREFETAIATARQQQARVSVAGSDQPFGCLGR